jgi:D-alanyl-lipoteichoic acid acyltransferase DltB (MBOAT superfamily)
MVINSFRFLAFFAVVFLVYFLPWMRQRHMRQNLWLLLASYFFYGFVDWKMLPVLLAITVAFWFLGGFIRKAIDRSNANAASRFTMLGVVLGIGLLFYFKYLNFFADSFAKLLNTVGLHASWTTLNIVLPVGVSFFTFKLISYVIEIHREKIQPSENFLEFATYIAFFPTIMSGPIDRPGKFLPQLRQVHQFNYNLAVDGCQQILWGIFTKMVIADNLARITHDAWALYPEKSSWELIYAMLLSPIQVYADFDGYSNMAIGVGKILGFNITRNFDHPLLARNVSEYWRRWHLSLTGWITDYVFMPLNVRFRNWGKMGIVLAISINLVVIGMWHGANWTYVLFGVYHSILFVPLILSGKFGKNKKLKPGRWGFIQFKDFLDMVGTHILMAIGHVIIFSAGVPSVVRFFSCITKGDWTFVNPLSLLSWYTILFIVVLLVLEWLTRNKEYATQRMSKDYTNNTFRLLLCDMLLALIIVLFGADANAEFIYFQY